MRAKPIAVLLALCFSTGANAQSCAELYGAVKRQAMYCGFFCEPEPLIPLQEAYESNCIAIVIPLASLAMFENPSDERGWSKTFPHASTPSNVPVLASE